MRDVGRGGGGARAGIKGKEKRREWMVSHT